MPEFKTEIIKRLRELNLSPERELEIAEELAQHLDEHYQQSLSRGASEAEAERSALDELKQIKLLGKELESAARSPAREPLVAGKQSGSTLLGDLAQDLRYGMRVLVANPAFTIVAVVALALGIGANSVIFSVVNAVLLRPLPFKDPQQLVMVWENAAHFGFPKNTPSPANFLDWAQQNTVFSAMAATAQRSYNLTGAGEPERLDGRRVSANLFDLLGVRPLIGRSFVPEEDKPGTRVVILSEGLWKRRFGQDAGIIGRAITLNSESYTVVGVMPRNVRLPGMDNWHDQFWVPIAFPSEEAAQRGNHFLECIARLKPGVNLQQARAEMETIAARLAQQYPEENTRIGAVVIPLQEHMVGDIRPALLVLLGAVGFVLLIACANVANLLLARAAVRQKEIALRLALGADRGRLTRQFLAESVLLSLIGGGAGLILASIGLNALKHYIPANISQADTISIDPHVLIFTAVVALLTGLVFGLAPAAQASNFNLNDTLKETGRDANAGVKGNRIRNALVIAEVAVSFTLLIGAGLLINSFLHLRNLDPGFRSDHLLTMKIELSDVKYPDKEGRAQFFDELIRRVQVLPGVEAVAAGNNLPLTYFGDSMPIGVEGVPDPPPDQSPDVVLRVVSPKYFGTMGIPLVAGRDFTEQDNAQATRVVIITEKTARHYWPGENPIGKRLKPGSSASDSPWREVVGIVKDVRQNDFVTDPKMQMYMPYMQVQTFPPNALVVRTRLDPLSLAVPVRNQVWAIDKDQPVSDIRAMDEIVADAMARQRFSMLLLGIFAALALVLATVGIYGVMSYSVTQRTREIGIRMALGAQRSDMLKMAVWHGFQLVLIGLVLGLVAAFLLTRVMATLLFGISATDPVTFIVISVILLGVALLASYIPALRATRVDPMVALRYQ